MSLQSSCKMQLNDNTTNSKYEKYIFCVNVIAKLYNFVQKRSNIVTDLTWSLCLVCFPDRINMTQSKTKLFAILETFHPEDTSNLY